MFSAYALLAGTSEAAAQLPLLGDIGPVAAPVAAHVALNVGHKVRRQGAADQYPLQQIGDNVSRLDITSWLRNWRPVFSGQRGGAQLPRRLAGGRQLQP